jgi:hypothetical protein
MASNEKNKKSNVIHLFGGEPPAVVDSEKVERFVNEHLGDFLFAVESLDQATCEDDFMAAKAEVERIVGSWPETW